MDCPRLGASVTAKVYVGDPVSRVRTGTVTYINHAHRWLLVDFGRGLRECYHFGEV